jgi:transglutaminase-like putative cysteine protease
MRLRHDAASSPLLDVGSELALTGVTVATVLGFSRLFDSGAYLAPLLAVAVIAHLLFAACRRLQWPMTLTTLIAGAGFILTVTWIRYPGTSAALFPTPTTFHHMHVDLQRAFNSFQQVVAPAPVLGGFILSLALLVWIVAYSGDWLAFRLRARAEAVVPAGGLFLFGAILGGHQHRLITALLFGFAVLVFVLFHRTAEHRQSAHWVAGDTPNDANGLVRTGIALSAVTAVLGVGMAGALPGHFDTPMLRWRHGGDVRETVSPLVDIRQRLTQNADTLLFRVKADRAEYWRLSALDDFDGTLWQSSGRFEPAPRAGDESPPIGGYQRVYQSYTITSLDQVWAPVAYQMQRQTYGPRLLYDDGSGTLIVPNSARTSNGMSYGAVSYVPQPTPEQLRRADTRPLSPTFVEHYTDIPNDVSDLVKPLAQDIVRRAGATTSYDKAIALQSYFLSPDFSYNTNPGINGEGTAAIKDFLQKKKGFCEQFAGTYAAMARSIGLPTRVAVGFTPGISSSNSDVYSVYGRQAHAWPEVFFEGIGWVPFDPTPNRGVPGGEGYTGVPFQQDTTPPAHATPQDNPAVKPNYGTPSQANGLSKPTRQAAQAPASSSGSNVRSDMAVFGLVVLGLLLAGIIAVAAFPATVWVSRRRRRRRARSPSDHVIVAWHEACDGLTLAGAVPLATETRLEFARRAGIQVPGARSALDELADLATTAAWAPGDHSDSHNGSDGNRAGPGVESATARHADHLSSSVVAIVRERLGRRGFLRARLDPRRCRQMLANDESD